MVLPPLLRRARALLVTLVVLLTVVGSPPAAQAAGRTLFVDVENGRDIDEQGWREDRNSEDDPWKSIRYAVRWADPGDIILVRGGTYHEIIGWGAVPATADAPIVLRNYPGERVLVRGQLDFKDADHWTIRGIDVTYDPDVGRSESLVAFLGGTGWQFLDSEVWGTRGVSNLLIRAHPTKGPANDFRVAGNCIHSNMATGDPYVNDHNIYLYPGYDSTGGVIERNILFDAPNGANIKAGGGTQDVGAARVSIRFNTMARSVVGITIPYGSHRNSVLRNLIVDQVNGSASYRMGLFGAHLYGPGNVAVANAYDGWPEASRSGTDSTHPIETADEVWVTPDFDGTATCDQFQPRDADAQWFGRYAPAGAVPAGVGTPVDDDAGQVTFEDVDGQFEDEIAWLADTGITRGCNPPDNTRFCPTSSVTRAQMAAFLTRALGLAPGSSTFSDVPDGHPFRADIAALADAGITRGCGGDRFCPDAPVTREQMAAFLFRALG